MKPTQRRWLDGNSIHLEPADRVGYHSTLIKTWVDVLFIDLSKDATRLTLGNAGHIMAILNNTVIGLCSQNGYQNLAQTRRLFNAQPELAFDLLRFDNSHSC